MSHNLTPEDIVIWLFILFMIFWLGYAAFESAKAKAFNEGYSRGRSSVRFNREIIE